MLEMLHEVIRRPRAGAVQGTRVTLCGNTLQISQEQKAVVCRHTTAFFVCVDTGKRKRGFGI